MKKLFFIFILLCIGSSLFYPQDNKSALELQLKNNAFLDYRNLNTLQNLSGPLSLSEKNMIYSLFQKSDAAWACCLNLVLFPISGIGNVIIGDVDNGLNNMIGSAISFLICIAGGTMMEKITDPVLYGICFMFVISSAGCSTYFMINGVVSSLAYQDRYNNLLKASLNISKEKSISSGTHLDLISIRF